MIESRSLPVDKLRWICAEDDFDFDSTKSVPALKEIIGQPRAIESLEFGLKIDSPGYNIFVSGLSGVGRITLIKKHLEELVKFAPTPEDICYVNNFQDPDCPKAIILPAGMGIKFRRDIDSLIDHLQAEVPRAFESRDYQSEVSAIAQASQASQQEMISALENFASERSYAVEFTKLGISLQPVRDGEVLEGDGIADLPEAEREVWDRQRQEVQTEVQGFLKAAKELNKKTSERIDGLKRRIGVIAVGGSVDLYREKYEEYPQISEYLDQWRTWAVDHLNNFGEEEKPQVPMMMHPEPEGDRFVKYRVNVIVDNSDVEGAPVVIETRPSYYNLFGRLERKTYMGAMITNFTMIKSGSILEARGGYLVINALDALTSPGVWDNIKKVVKHGEVRIEDLGEQYSLVPLSGMKPEPIKAKLKILMIGSSQIYHLLQRGDDDFNKIFKVKVDFDNRMPREKALTDFPAFVSTRVREEGLLHFDRSGLAALVEEASRQVADCDWVSTRFAGVADLIREASFWGHEDGAKLVARQHVEKAIAKKRFRSNLVEDRISQLFQDGTLLVDVAGERVGQVNGLAVLDLGDISFGKPSRITARTWMGRAGIVDIEREAKLAGKVYQKGVLILSGYLGAKYAQSDPLTLSASLAFEQSYDGIDGDSASSTEIYALLSSLAELPIRQGIAVTGSVNQYGDVQAIGGVNEKIEGYFAVCKIKGLTGDQGVMIPASNERNLMLGDEVREAVAGGQFRIWSVENVDQGLEILTGTPAGEVDGDGVFPEGSVHRRVRDRLDLYLEGLKGDREENNNDHGRGD